MFQLFLLQVISVTSSAGTENNVKSDNYKKGNNYLCRLSIESHLRRSQCFACWQTFPDVSEAAGSTEIRTGQHRRERRRCAEKRWQIGGGTDEQAEPAPQQQHSNSNDQTNKPLIYSGGCNDCMLQEVLMVRKLVDGCVFYYIIIMKKKIEFEQIK